MGRVEQVLGSRARIVLLRVLADSDTEMTGRGVWEAAKGRGGPNALATVQRALDDLVRAGVVTCRDAFGFNARFYRLDRTHPFIERGILPLFELDGPIQDPAQLLKRLFAGADKGIGVYRAALEDPDATPGELVVHMVAQAAGDAAEAERRVRSVVEYVAEQIGRSARVEVLGFQAARERVRDDPEFRLRVAEQGALLVGTPFLDSSRGISW